MKAINAYEQNYNADQQVNKFLHQYEAQAGFSSHKRYYRRRPISYQNWTHSDPSVIFDHEVDTEPMIEMYIPKHQFRRLVEREEEFQDLIRGNEEANYQMRRKLEEERIRKQNPAVQNAYEKYLMLLELSRK